VPVVSGLPRREFLRVSVSGAVTCLAGCKPTTESTTPATPRTDVPLRVLVCGSEALANTVSTAWGGIALQPLTIERIEPRASRTELSGQASGPAAAKDSARVSSDFVRQMIDAMERNDVAIVPCGLTADLHETESLMPLAQDVIDDPAMGAELFLPVLSESMMRWAGKYVAFPLGCVQPAMLISATLASTLNAAGASGIPRSWEEFIRVAESLQQRDGGANGNGKKQWRVAEPLAEGAAAKMFLWRASDADPAVWLFDRETFAPAIATEGYVQTLDWMRRCAAHYAQPRMTAGEVWNGVANGEIDLAIGWPAPTGDPARIEPLGDAEVFAMPRSSLLGNGNSGSTESTAVPAVMPDSDALMGVISYRCRQTAAAKRFLIWLTGGEGSEMVQAIAPQLGVLRASTVSDSPQGLAATDAYHTFLKSRLASLSIRPTLRLHGYDRYLMALDEQVLACLDDKLAPRVAMENVAAAWQEITAQIGPKRQAQAWRFAQGLRH